MRFFEKTSGSVIKKAENNPARREFLEILGVGLAAMWLGGDSVDRFKSLLEKTANETYEKGPRVTFSIFYSRHALFEDLSGFKDEVAHADILVPEYPYVTDNLERRFNELSRGSLTVTQMLEEDFGAKEDEPIKQTFLYSLLEAIYNSNKIIYFVDLRADDPKVKEIEEMLPKIDKFLPSNFQLPYEEILKKMRPEWKKFADLQKYRERFMLEQLASLTEAIKQEKFSALKDKDTVNILLQLGYNHTPIFHTLSHSRAEVRRSIPSMPFIYGYGDEIIRRYLFEKKVDDELFSRLLFILWNAAAFPEWYLQHQSEAGYFERSLSSSFKLDEIRELHETARVTENPPHTAREWFIRKFHEKGIQLKEQKTA